MIRPCFSTVACPDWTLSQVAQFAAQEGFEGVELRSQGTGGGEFANDPSMTCVNKTKRLFADAAVEVAGVSTGITLDRPFLPPVVGRLLPDATIDVNEGRNIVDIASGVGAGYIRVFGFRVTEGEPRTRTITRIAERLFKVADHARHKKVRVLIENGGDFPYADDLVQIIDATRHPAVAAAYDTATAKGAGEDPVTGIAALSGVLDLVRLRCVDAHSCGTSTSAAAIPPSRYEGDWPEIIAAASAGPTDVWASVTWDAAWVAGLEDAQQALVGVPDKLLEWAAVTA